MQMSSLGAELFHADRQRHAKSNSPLRNFANALNKTH